MSPWLCCLFMNPMNRAACAGFASATCSYSSAACCDSQGRGLGTQLKRILLMPDRISSSHLVRRSSAP